MREVETVLVPAGRCILTRLGGPDEDFNDEMRYMDSLVPIRCARVWILVRQPGSA